MAYFDTTPTGQIMNLFSKDIDTIDAEFLTVFYHILFYGAKISLVFIFICVNNIVVTPLLFIFYLIIKFLYIPIAKIFANIKKLNIQAISPIISNLNEFFNGIIIFRQKKEKIAYFEKLFIRNVNRYVDTYFTMFGITQLSFLRIDLFLEFFLFLC